MKTVQSTAARSYMSAQGFTLIELLLVVLVLMLLGGGVVRAMAPTQDHVRHMIAEHEMNTVRDALLHYRQDLGALPAASNAADLGFLLLQPSGTPAWNAATARGWRGSYLLSASDGLVDIGDNLKNDGSGYPVAVDLNAHNAVRAIADPFIALPVLQNNSNQYSPCSDSDTDNNCLLDWRNSSGEARKLKAGRPYLLFDSRDPARARLVSMGIDGRYAGINSAEPCSAPANSDDLVLCLYR